MALKAPQFIVTVSSAGSAVQFKLTSFEVQSFLITANPSNTGTVYIGDSNVDASLGLGTPLIASDSVSFESGIYEGTNEKWELSSFYVDSTASGDKIIIQYVEREVDL